MSTCDSLDLGNIRILTDYPRALARCNVCISPLLLPPNLLDGSWNWVNQPVNLFLVGCLNLCLQGTSIWVGSPQPWAICLAASLKLAILGN
jgi:hypothetical protein